MNGIIISSYLVKGKLDEICPFIRVEKVIRKGNKKLKLNNDNNNEYKLCNPFNNNIKLVDEYIKSSPKCIELLNLLNHDIIDIRWRSLSMINYIMKNYKNYNINYNISNYILTNFNNLILKLYINDDVMIFYLLQVLIECIKLSSIDKLNYLINNKNFYTLFDKHHITHHGDTYNIISNFYNDLIYGDYNYTKFHNIYNIINTPLDTPLEVHPAVSSSNYLSLKSIATPGDRGVESETIYGSRGELNREGHHGEWETSGGTASGMKSSTGPRVEPAADLREAKGEVYREATTASGVQDRTSSGEAVCKTTSGGILSGEGVDMTSSGVVCYDIYFMNGKLKLCLLLLLGLRGFNIFDRYEILRLIFDHIKYEYYYNKILIIRLIISILSLLFNKYSNKLSIHLNINITNDNHNINTLLPIINHLTNTINHLYHSNSPPEVTTTVPLGVEPSSNYLPVDGKATPGDRGECEVVGESGDKKHYTSHVSDKKHHNFPPEVTSTVGLAYSSSNYFPVNGIATPRDRGEVSDGSSIMGMMEDGAKDKLDVTSGGIPGSDLRELEGEVNRRGATPSGRHGRSDLSWKGGVDKRYDVINELVELLFIMVEDYCDIIVFVDMSLKFDIYKIPHLIYDRLIDDNNFARLYIPRLKCKYDNNNELLFILKFLMIGLII